MLYKLGTSNGKFEKLCPVAFKDFVDLGSLEKDMEKLIASSILEVLFEDSGLMPIFQERRYQPEADIYALNEKGELIIFELKRGTAGEDAVHQALRYTQDAGQWSFSRLEEQFRKYVGPDADLLQMHREAFNLEHALDAEDIHNKQRLMIIGSAADDHLIDAVDYWKRQGISIEFLPYRIYELGDEIYFEFFALPYDRHRNPADTKGVLFDTNRSWDEDAIWYMLENNRVAAFGDAKRFIEYLHSGDIVFFSHKYEGLVAAAKVKPGDIKAPDENTLYREVEFITPIPKKGEPRKAMPFRTVAEVTGKNFYWARIIKVPDLSKDEAEDLVKALTAYLEASAS